MGMRRFYLARHDVSRDSPTAAVIEGVEFEDGRVVIHWITEAATIATYASLDEAIRVRGPRHLDDLVWYDRRPSSLVDLDDDDDDGDGTSIGSEDQ